MNGRTDLTDQGSIRRALLWKSAQVVLGYEKTLWKNVWIIWRMTIKWLPQETVQLEIRLEDNLSKDLSTGSS